MNFYSCYIYRQDMQRHIDLLLHPRVPPLIRREPYVQSLSFYHNEKSREEASDQESVGLAAPEYPLKLSSNLPKEAQHIIQKDHEAPPQTSAIANQNLAASPQPERDVFRPRPVVQDIPMAPMASSQSRIQMQAQPSSAPQLPLTGEDEEMPPIDMASDSDESDG